MIKEISGAKINLGLHILNKRSDGYHNLESFFLPIRWHDVLTFTPTSSLSMSCSNILLPTDRSNLCMKAALSLLNYCTEKKGVHIHLEKNIPMGAGLGGGSSNAATVLLTLNNLWELHLPAKILFDEASKLGADVPFFLKNLPAFATGIGDKLSSFPAFQFPYHLVVVKPTLSVATKDAYAWITPNAKKRPNLVNLIQALDLALWKKELVNDFETPIFNKYPELHRLKQQFYTLGAGYASMSGSGTALYGVFSTEELAQQACKFFQKDYQTWAS